MAAGWPVPADQHLPAASITPLRTKLRPPGWARCDNGIESARTRRFGDLGAEDWPFSEHGPVAGAPAAQWPRPGGRRLPQAAPKPLRRYTAGPGSPATLSTTVTRTQNLPVPP